MEDESSDFEMGNDEINNNEEDDNIILDEEEVLKIKFNRKMKMIL